MRMSPLLTHMNLNCLSFPVLLVCSNIVRRSFIDVHFDFIRPSTKNIICREFGNFAIAYKGSIHLSSFEFGNNDTVLGVADVYSFCFYDVDSSICF